MKKAYIIPETLTARMDIETLMGNALSTDTTNAAGDDPTKTNPIETGGAAGTVTPSNVAPLWDDEDDDNNSWDTLQ